MPQRKAGNIFSSACQLSCLSAILGLPLRLQPPSNLRSLQSLHWHPQKMLMVPLRPHFDLNLLRRQIGLRRTVSGKCCKRRAPSLRGVRCTQPSTIKSRNAVQNGLFGQTEIHRQRHFTSSFESSRDIGTASEAQSTHRISCSSSTSSRSFSIAFLNSFTL